MLPAVEFDNQHRFETRKVREVTADWALTAELVGVELAIAQG